MHEKYESVYNLITSWNLINISIKENVLNDKIL